MEITETEDGFESDSEREESSEEDEDAEKLRQHQQRTAKAISRHSTRRSSQQQQQQQQASEDKGSHCILKHSLWLCIFLFLQFGTISKVCASGTLKF
jgi:hypothetical protein